MSQEVTAERVEEGLWAARLSLGRVPGGEFYAGPDLKWAYTGTPVLNTILGANLDDSRIDERTAEVLARFDAWGVEVEWLLGSSTSPADLGSRLVARHGFRREEPRLQGLGLDLSVLPPAPAMPPGLTLQYVDHCDAVRRWHRLIRPEYRDLLVALGFGEHLPWRRYVGLLQGVPVAVGMLHLSGGTATLDFVHGPRDAQGRGITLALVWRLLYEARFRECRLAVLAADASGAGLYRRLGFREYCRVERYVRGPGAEGSSQPAAPAAP